MCEAREVDGRIEVTHIPSVGEWASLRPHIKRRGSSRYLVLNQNILYYLSESMTEDNKSLITRCYIVCIIFAVVPLSD